MIDRIISRLPGWAKAPIEVLVTAIEELGNDRASRMAAATAYRTVFALAPLLMILVAVLGAFLGSREQAQLQIVDTVQGLVGTEVARTIGSVMDSASRSAETAAVIGGVLLLWTASSLFLEVQRDLNDIFDVPSEVVSRPMAVVRTRVVAFIWAVGLGLLLVVTLGVNAVWRYIGGLLPDSLAGSHGLVSRLAPLASVLLLALVFALVFKTMTAAVLRWRAVLVGGLFTAAIFIAASYGVGVYFQFSEPTALGFTGSLVIVVFLAFFFSLAFLLGAEVTKVYADRLARRPAMGGPTPIPDMDQQVVVARPPAGLPQSAFVAFIIGLFVGWRRSRR